MRRFVVGTAGHVDHGKTTLVRALTGVDTDRLPEEKRRGISIELGFAPLDLGGGMRASIVDVPGHRKLVRTMIAGASGIEAVMLVVAADEGVMPQTREHVAVCEMLGIARAVVVLTKVDAVDLELAQVAREEARALLSDRWRAEFVSCSCVTGEGVEQVREALRRMLADLPERTRGEHARLGVDRIFTVRGAGTVVTGTLVSGRVAAGDAVFVVRGRGSRATIARTLHVHDETSAEVEAPTRLAVNLAGVALDDVHRGDVVTTDPRLRATALMDVRLGGRHALRRGASVTVHAGTASTTARIDAIDAVDGGAVARVRMASAVVAVGGERVVLRSGDGPAETRVDGGVVLDSRPDRRTSGARRRALAAALATIEPTTTARALVEACAPRVLARDEVASRFAVDGASIERAADDLARRGDLARIGDHGWIASAHLRRLVDAAREAVRRHHESAPLERGLRLETLRARLAAAGAGPHVAEEAIRIAAASGDARERLCIEEDVVRVGDGATADSETLARLAAIERIVVEAAAAGATEVSIADKARASTADARAALQKLARDGAALRLGELWFARDVVDAARSALVDHFARATTLSVVEFKSAAGFARKQAVLVLEHFDRVGLTRRQGDTRVLR